MNKSLKFLALVIATGFPFLAFVEIAGAAGIASRYAGSTLAAFVLVMGAIIALRDYSSASRPLVIPNPVAAPVGRRDHALDSSRGLEIDRLAA